jgi:exonuclease SbcD
MQRVIFSADWHLGKKLHSVDLSEDMQKFFEWLLKKIQEQNVSYLLVAGDIFDSNNPPHEAIKMYYSFLAKLKDINCKAIIIAGNHDSPSFIDVPKDLLSNFNVSVFGMFPGIENVKEIFVPLLDNTGMEVAVVAAIPFLQDRFVRQVGEGEGAKVIDEKIKQGMKKLFVQIGDSLKEAYPNIPKIGMAHLHAQGETISEAERDIQIGKQDGVPSNDLDQFDYLALGHIHIGHAVIKNKIQYASSPISLGFTENTYNHKVVMLEIDNNEIIETEIKVPKQRSLYQVQGTMTEVTDKINSLKKKYSLQVLLDIKIVEDHYDPTIQDKLQALNDRLAIKGDMKIVNTRVQFKDKTSTLPTGSFDIKTINELDPGMVFKSYLDIRGEQDQDKLVEIFTEILSDLKQA